MKKSLIIASLFFSVACFANDSGASTQPPVAPDYFQSSTASNDTNDLLQESVYGVSKEKATGKSKQELANDLNNFIQAQDLDKLIASVNALKSVMPSSEQIFKAYKRIIELGVSQKQDLLSARTILSMISEYKLILPEETAYLMQAYDIYMKHHMLDQAEFVLERLNQIDPQNFGEKLLQFKVEYASNAKEKSAAIEQLEQKFSLSFNKHSALVLGDYYADKLPYKALAFYHYCSAEKEAELYYKLGDTEKYNTLYAALSSSDKATMDAYIAKEKSEKQLEVYRSKAKSNFESHYYQLARIYYTRILSENSSKEDSAEALQNLGKIAFSKADFDSAIGYLSKLVNSYPQYTTIESYFDLGFAYYKVNQIQFSKKYLSYIVDNFPNTFYAEKAKIYLSKIN